MKWFGDLGSVIIIVRQRDNAVASPFTGTPEPFRAKSISCTAQTKEQNFAALAVTQQSFCSPGKPGTRNMHVQTRRACTSLRLRLRVFAGVCLGENKTKKEE